MCLLVINRAMEAPVWLKVSLFHGFTQVGYLLVAKPLLQNYPATLVTSGSYMFASAGMSPAGHGRRGALLWQKRERGPDSPSYTQHSATRSTSSLYSIFLCSFVLG